MRLRDERSSASAHVFEVQVELTSLVRHNQPLNPENLNIEPLLSSENTVVLYTAEPDTLGASIFEHNGLFVVQDRAEAAHKG